MRRDATNRNSALPGPVAVGGVGGSGTRLVANLMQALGYYIGDDLNESLDNLWFTLLFKRPDWFFGLDAEAREQDVRQALRIFEKAMTCGLRRKVEPLERDFAERAGVEFASYSRTLGAGRAQVRSILRSKDPRKRHFTGWGWKEPNTHVFLPQACEFFSDLRYVHVMRNGLDMAYSSNVEQLMSWGRLYGIACPESPRQAPRAALQYWVRANRDAIARAKERLGQRFHVILFDKLCEEPRRHLSDLAKFLGYAPSSDELNELIDLVHYPPTIGRYRQHDLSGLDPEDVAAVCEFGFDAP
jgi:hypothetical protein